MAIAGRFAGLHPKTTRQDSVVAVGVRGCLGVLVCVAVALAEGTLAVLAVLLRILLDFVEVVVVGHVAEDGQRFDHLHELGVLHACSVWSTISACQQAGKKGGGRYSVTG
jgi:hypothetical protein